MGGNNAEQTIICNATCEPFTMRNYCFLRENHPLLARKRQNMAEFFARLGKNA